MGLGANRDFGFIQQAAQFRISTNLLPRLGVPFLPGHLLQLLANSVADRPQLLDVGWFTHDSITSIGVRISMAR